MSNSKSLYALSSALFVVAFAKLKSTFPPLFPRFRSRRKERQIHYTQARADTSWRENGATRDDQANWLSREIRFYRGDANEIRGIKGNFQGGAELQNRRIILWYRTACCDERDSCFREDEDDTFGDAPRMFCDNALALRCPGGHRARFAYRRITDDVPEAITRVGHVALRYQSPAR